MFTSFPEFRDRTIIFNGFSKAYAMTGLRLGYIMAPAAIINAMNILHQYVVLCPNVTAQYGAIAALKYCRQDVDNMVAEYSRRRQIMIDASTRWVCRCMSQRRLLCFPLHQGNRPFQHGIC